MPSVTNVIAGLSIVLTGFLNVRVASHSANYNTAQATATTTASASTTASVVPSSAGCAASDSQPSATQSLPQPSHAAVEAMLQGLKAIDYYPAYHPWDKMWAQWDPAAIDADFARIASLNANAVRIIVQAWTIGYPDPDPTMEQHILDTVAMASRHHLLVELTLFDWWSSYTDIAGSEQWACSVLTPLAGDPRIAFIELQNETDTTVQGAVNWVSTMTHFLQQIDGGLPVALSAFRLADLQTLAVAGNPDLLSFHVVAGASQAYTTFQAAMAIAGPIPLYIGEAGTSPGVGAPPQDGCGADICAQRYQEHYYREIQYAASLLGLPPVAVWTLYDFAPNTVPSGMDPNNYHYGLFHADGSPKSVAARVKTFFGTGQISTDFNGGFESRAGNLPSEWHLYHESEGHFAWDDRVSHSGKASARISKTTSDANGGPSFYTSPINPLVIPGHTYEVDGWVRGLNLTGLTTINLTWWGANNQYLGQVESPPLPRGTSKWTHLTARGQAPAGAAYDVIYLSSPDNRGSAWFDDISYK